jgi:3-hydroxyacyl-CoA dehydrogenase
MSLYRIDDAMRAGFGWEIGPFEQWDAIGVEKLTAGMKEAGFKVNAWVDEMLAAGFKTFYK